MAELLRDTETPDARDPRAQLAGGSTSDIIRQTAVQIETKRNIVKESSYTKRKWWCNTPPPNRLDQALIRLTRTNTPETRHAIRDIGMESVDDAPKE